MERDIPIDIAQPSHIGGDHYTRRMPSPPRIVVPAPSDDLVANVMASRPMFLSPGYDVHDAEAPTTRTSSWTYQDRNSCQQILPYLWLGPMFVTRNAAWFKEQGITMALGVRGQSPALLNAALQRVREMGIEAQYVDVPNQPALIKTFPIATKLLKDHLGRLDQQGQYGKVLVFCETGNDRSAAIVAAFMAEVYADVDYIRALQICQTQRFSAMFHDENKRALQAYWDIICAQRGVASAKLERQQQGLLRSPSVVKRHHEEDVDNVTGGPDAVQGSRHYAPFAESEASDDGTAMSI